MELLGELDKRLAVDGRHAGDMGDGNVALTDERIRQDTAAMLCALVAGMSLDNFVVRARRRWVEAWAQPEAWRCPTIDQLGEVAEQLSGLPSAVRDDDEEKRRTVV
ncbi:hypothetical protein H4CHR_00566 [Variovorax sp. PBS-H4]|uniref:hypothetical protein n=1 Tax=Variovorax sp. PBS-H4 TaxID=434008 RepID=UPI0013168922|nr:hypothetical protein [Variovorax sp. PBS-H4]VTU20346.1 hypothetical protein H4CHR_00566 [Variovorax sp. PBS-H4]